MRTGAFILLLSQCLAMISGKVIIEWLHVGSCKESDKTAVIHFDNSQYGMVSSDRSECNTTMVVTKNVNTFECNVKAYKCKSTSELDCELFMTVPVSDCCSRLTEKGQFYSMFAEHMTPALSCPLKKGAYQMTNAEVKADLIQHMMEDNCIYMMKYHFVIHGAHGGCIMTKTKKIRLRSRKKTGGS